MVAMSGAVSRSRSGAATMEPSAAPIGRPRAERGDAVLPVEVAAAPSAPVLVAARARWFRLARECAWLAAVGACAFVGVLLFGLLALDSGARPVPDATAVVRVAEGDTLWSMAARFAPDSDQGAVVGRIVELNRLDPAAPALGGALVVPAQRG
ncbi:LysM peptidoglycan-binding domain-containing protein [Saccharopolyspora gregorii]|uniref:LysM domain-containing protein n=1 Tax=Saccharopolyspora gregorii TaxID=33914 RepID=A0ABP6RTP4_9PSEU